MSTPEALGPAPMEPVQLDLFHDVDATRRGRLVDALTCLRDSMSTSLDVVVVLDAPRGAVDSRQPQMAGDWAYCVSRDGVRVESRHEWWTVARTRHGEPWGWNRTPANLTTWPELRALIGDDPRRAQLAAWVASLPVSGRWRWTSRPHELTPGADGTHHSHIDHDRADPLWPGRLAAWRLLFDLLDHAIHAAGGPR